MDKILVTGGAGFIGSHLVDAFLARDSDVVVMDNLSAGTENNLPTQPKNKLAFLKADLKNPELRIPDGIDSIYHLAANPEVRVGSTTPEVHFNENLVCTYNLLEASRKHGGIKSFVFLSTSTVYGEPSRIPTPEEYGPLRPISVYGASKLASEALVSAYASSYGFHATIFRLANVIGTRSNHGIIHDVAVKLQSNQEELEILGDGTQTKSYLHVKDCVSGILKGVENSGKAAGAEIFNLGSKDKINVMRIVEIVCEQMKLRDVKFVHKNATEDGRGWIGDVKFMQLDVSKLESLGWKPTLNSEQAVKTTVKEMLVDST